MKQQLEALLQNFDEQEDIKKRSIIQLIIEKAIVHPNNKLELWIRREIDSKNSVSNFGHKKSSLAEAKELNSSDSNVSFSSISNPIESSCHTGGKKFVSGLNGGSDGTRTHDLRRDKASL